MRNSRLVLTSTFATIVAAAATLPASARAQYVPTPRATVQLAFGYECGDRFRVRNDGAQPVVVDYAVAGSRDLTEIRLNGQQSAAITSTSSNPLELYVNGNRVATEPKGNRACANDGNGNGDVVVHPLDSGDAAAAAAQPAYPDAPAAAYVTPPAVVYDYGYPPYPYYGYYPYASPYYGYGYLPYYGPAIGIRIGGGGFIGARGGIGGGVFRGGRGRGR